MVINIKWLLSYECLLFLGQLYGLCLFYHGLLLYILLILEFMTLKIFDFCVFIKICFVGEDSCGFPLRTLCSVCVINLTVHIYLNIWNSFFFIIIRFQDYYYYMVLRMVLYHGFHGMLLKIFYCIYFYYYILFFGIYGISKIGYLAYYYKGLLILYRLINYYYLLGDYILLIIISLLGWKTVLLLEQVFERGFEEFCIIGEVCCVSPLRTLCSLGAADLMEQDYLNTWNGIIHIYNGFNAFLECYYLLLVLSGNMVIGNEVGFVYSDD